MTRRPVMEIQPGFFIPLPASFTLEQARELAETPYQIVGQDGGILLGEIIGITMRDGDSDEC
ncbi:MAG: hypothetical protein UBAL2_80490432 [Leptospirillum rubarum]|uniref:Uncharacterized protein n=1 Tax=Leptospirillum sp. Group II '5-way CG' TaxID=419541 RepID=B6AS96_9BACT|nr:MAG: hypothetical protein UBAL2_80490432 [Leptospirillum rubarum]EDZ38345.1 MAG: hypothetical protein CGL2_08982006 [Leptospirillum sp. Group II '5-way CG']